MAKRTASAKKALPIQQTTSNYGQQSSDEIPWSFYFLIAVLALALIGAIVASFVV